MNTQIIKLLLEEIENSQKTIDTLNGELSDLKMQNERVPVPIEMPKDWLFRGGLGNIIGEDTPTEKTMKMEFMESKKLLSYLIVQYLNEFGKFSHVREFSKYIYIKTRKGYSIPEISAEITKLRKQGSIIKEVEKTGSKVMWGFPEWKKKGKVIPGRESTSNFPNKWDIKMWDEQ